MTCSLQFLSQWRRSVPHRVDEPRGFTLLELVLSLALCGVLLVLISGAINLFLIETSQRRDEVEMAQLARVLLRQIEADLLHVAYLEPQDASGVTAALQQLGSANEEAARAAQGGRVGGGQANGAADDRASDSLGDSAQQTAAETPPPGVYGTLYELLIDRRKLISLRETAALSLISSQQGEQAGLASDITSDVESVRYFVREGRRVAAGSRALVSGDAATQSTLSGLVRQVVGRQRRLYADQAGVDLAGSGERLLAPEVVYIEFRYFDGTNVVESWDSEEQGGTPVAVEVQLWLMSDSEYADVGTNASNLDVTAMTTPYRLTVKLPAGAIATGSASSSESDGSSTESSSGQSSSTGASSTSGGR